MTQCFTGETLYEKIRQIPLFDTHMHCSSIASVGDPCVGGFATDHVPGCPAGPTDLITLLHAPYLFGQHIGTGLWKQPQADTFEARWAALVPCLKAEQGTGLFLALDTALEQLHGISLRRALREGIETAQQLSARIAARYAEGLFTWSAAAMAQGNILHAFKPVHTDYLCAPQDAQESRLYTPIWRTDDMFGTVDAQGRLQFPELSGEISSLTALEAAADAAFARMRQLKTPCIKQLQAYHRTLRFEAVTRAQAELAFPKALRGDRTAALAVQDYMMEYILGCGLPYQLHTGMANLGETSPVALRGVIERHPGNRFVLLHTYPYNREALAMLWIYPNVYLDLSWLQLISPAVLRDTLREGLSAAPMNRFFLSTDATSPEEQYGAAVGLRRVLAQVLEEKMALDDWDEATALEAAHALLHRNAESFYGTGV